MIRLTGDLEISSHFEEHDLFRHVRSNIYIFSPSEYSVTEDADFPDRITIPTYGIINISTLNVESAFLIPVTHSIPIKIAAPVGILPQFEKALNQQYGQAVYLLDAYMECMYLYDDEKAISGVLFDNIEFVFQLYAKRLTSKDLSLIINRNTPIISLYFTWYVQCKMEMPIVENIYVLQNDTWYEQLSNDFKQQDQQ